MSKINLKIELIGPEENINLITSGIKNKNKIIYMENNIKVSITLLKNELNIKRICNEYEVELNLKNKVKTISNYKLFGSSKIFRLETFTNFLDIGDNKIDVDYNLEGNNFKFTIEVV